MIIKYNFDTKNQPTTFIHVEIGDGIARVFVTGVRDTIFVPEGTGLDITVGYKSTVDVAAVGQVEVIRNSPGEARQSQTNEDVE